ncbi:MAG: glucosamine-6-phosphate deaminase [Alphaproteobacteria bacterium]|nr:glucosamine-6-phosphate deaminase [Alphaproteobacteria bacterium]
MLVHILPDAQAVSQRAARLAANLVRAKAKAVLGLAAGATPLAMYGELVRAHKTGEVDLSAITVFGLDEYLSLGSDHPASCAYTLRRHLIEPLGLPDDRVHLLDGLAGGNLVAYCADYEARIKAAGGLDLQILGLGVNGHIGFNEPGCSLGGRTHTAVLRSSTLATNKAVFAPYGEEVPRGAVSMGVATILSAKRILLLATGPAKAQAVAKAVEGPVTTMLPASALQMHPDALLLLDEAAAADLSLKADYQAQTALLEKLGAVEG